jgi:phosphoglycolate phosphatase
MQAIFFDLDGTLSDPKAGITGSIQYALEKLAIEVPAADDLTWCIGPPLLQSLESLLGDRHLAEQALVLYRERFSKTGLFENDLYPGMLDVLSDLAAAGYRLFIATSKPTVYAKRIVDHFAIAPFSSRFLALN